MNLNYNHYRQDRNLGITFRGGYTGYEARQIGCGSYYYDYQLRAIQNPCFGTKLNYIVENGVRIHVIFFVRAKEFVVRFLSTKLKCNVLYS